MSKIFRLTFSVSIRSFIDTQRASSYQRRALRWDRNSFWEDVETYRPSYSDTDLSVSDVWT